jgi:hypothetical protein
MNLAARFNDTGVRLYKVGRGDAAYEVFFASVEILLNGMTVADMLLLRAGSRFTSAFVVALGKDQEFQLSQQLQKRTETSATTPVASEAMLLSTNLLAALSLSPHSLIDDLRTDTYNDAITMEQCPYIYLSAFSVTGTACHYPFHHVVIAVATDLYNMALVLHRGKVMDRSSLCFQRALVLYSSAGELLWYHLGHNGLLQQSAGVGSLAHLYCALLNNTGYLLHQIGDFGWAQLFFLRLSQFLDMLSPPCDNEEQNERDAFQLNVLVLHRPMTGAASA